MKYASVNNHVAMPQVYYLCRDVFWTTPWCFKLGARILVLFHYLRHFVQVGNALTDDFHDHYGIFQFMWTTGLISDQTYKLLNIFCDYESFVHTSPQCEKILDIASTEAGNIDSYSIFTPTCHASFASSKNKVMKRLNVSFQHRNSSNIT